MEQNDIEILLPCPHCGYLFITTKLTICCAIYRHAVLKTTMQQINPHATKEECDRLVEENAVFGCAKPFRVIKKDNSADEYEAIICDYI